MNSHLNPEDQSLTVRVPGDLTSTTAAAVRDEIGRLLPPPDETPPPWKTLRLELADATMVDSVGLNLIVTVLKAVQRAGGRMQLACSSPNVHRTLLFTRLDQHMEVLML